MQHIKKLFVVITQLFLVMGSGSITFSVPNNVDTSAVQNIFAQRSNDRKQLDALRNRHMQAFSRVQEPTKYIGQDPIQKKSYRQYITIAKNVSRDTAAYISNMLDEISNNMQAPKPCKICCIVFGSMARGEPGFFTDLEMGVLVEEKTPATVRYVHNLIQHLADRLYLLGEHPDSGGMGIRLDEADNAPLYKNFTHRYSYANPFFASDSATAGSRLYIATPYEFARHYDPQFIREQNKRKRVQEQQNAVTKAMHQYKHVPSHVKRPITEYVKEAYAPLTKAEKRVSKDIQVHCRNFAYLWGDEDLLDMYHTYREQFLAQPAEEGITVRQKVATEKMQKDIKSFGKLSMITGEDATLPKSIDVKRQLYRFPEQVITNLGFWFNTQSQNGAEVLRELYDRDIISKRCLRALTDYLNFAMGVRLRQQWIVRCQIGSIPTDMQMYDELRKQCVFDIAKAYAKEKRIAREKGHGQAWREAVRELSTSRAKLALNRYLQPGCPDSILTPDIISAIQERYIPIARKLYRYLQRFVDGEYDAFRKW